MDLNTITGTAIGVSVGVTVLFGCMIIYWNDPNDKGDDS